MLLPTLEWSWKTSFPPWLWVCLSSTCRIQPSSRWRKEAGGEIAFSSTFFFLQSSICKSCLHLKNIKATKGAEGGLSKTSKGSCPAAQMCFLQPMSHHRPFLPGWGWALPLPRLPAEKPLPEESQCHNRRAGTEHGKLGGQSQGCPVGQQGSGHCHPAALQHISVLPPVTKA